MKVSTGDINHHTVQIGIDVFEPIALHQNRTHLNMFFEEAREHYPELFERVVSSDTEFTVSRRFSKPGGEKVEVPIFQMTPRGPAFAMPLYLTDIGETGFAGTYVQKLESIKRLFFKSFPDRKIIKYGVVREVIFGTGSEPTSGILRAPLKFSGADLLGGTLVAKYADEKCNVAITLQPVRSARVTRLGVGVQTNQETGYGVHIKLDVSSKEIRPLDSTDIDWVKERADTLWPDAVVQLINSRKDS